MRFSLVVCAIGLVPALNAKSLPDQDGIPFDRLNVFPTLSGRSPSGATMSPDGKHIVFS